MARRAKTKRQLARKKPSREPYDKILIVCEGKKTEPLYFTDIKNHYQIHSANIVITGDCGSDPLSIYKFAKGLYQEETDTPFDKVFCVFDKDTHQSYDIAIDYIRKATPKRVFFAITSVPCFEFWVLLHFLFTTTPFEHKEKNSAASQVLKILKQ